MPQVIHSFRGDNRTPRLKLPKVERAILENAAGLCRAISMATAGHHAEMAAETAALADKLLRLSLVEDYDLTKPF